LQAKPADWPFRLSTKSFWTGQPGSMKRSLTPVRSVPSTIDRPVPSGSFAASWPRPRRGSDRSSADSIVEDALYGKAERRGKVVEEACHARAADR
jgi:hypothetical protein